MDLLCWERLTFYVVLGVGLLGLVVMYHLDYLEEVVLWELREGFGELLHVDVAVGLGALLLGLAGCGAICLAGWTGLFQSFDEVLLGVAEGLRVELVS